MPDDLVPQVDGSTSAVSRHEEGKMHKDTWEEALAYIRENDEHHPQLQEYCDLILAEIERMKRVLCQAVDDMHEDSETVEELEQTIQRQAAEIERLRESRDKWKLSALRWQGLPENEVRKVMEDEDA